MTTINIALVDPELVDLDEVIKEVCFKNAAVFDKPKQTYLLGANYFSNTRNRRVYQALMTAYSRIHSELNMAISRYESFWNLLPARARINNSVYIRDSYSHLGASIDGLRYLKLIVPSVIDRRLASMKHPHRYLKGFSFLGTLDILPGTGKYICRYLSRFKNQLKALGIAVTVDHSANTVSMAIQAKIGEVPIIVKSWPLFIEQIPLRQTITHYFTKKLILFIINA